MTDTLLEAINDRLMQGVTFSEIVDMYEVSIDTLYRLNRKGELAKCEFSRLNHKQRHVATKLMALRRKDILVNLADVREIPKYCPILGHRLTYLNNDPVYSADIVMIDGSPYVVSSEAARYFRKNTYKKLQKLFSFVNKKKVGKYAS